MKILMFTPYVPYPPNSGGQTRTFNLIKHLSQKHEVTSFSFLRTDHSVPDLRELKKYCKKIEIFRRKKSFRSLAKILRTGLSRYPYLVNMYRDSQAKKAITEELATGSYDLIHVETYYIMPNIPATSVPVLLAEQTIEYQVYQHYAQTTSLWPMTPFFYIDVAKHKYWEKYYWQKAQKVVAMSLADKEKMLDLVPNLNVGVVPNGVDTDFFKEKVVRERSGDRILFVGNFNWLQNREAAELLARHIWPRIKSQLSLAKLWIVGREPSPTIKSLAGADIKVSADVEDIRTAYQEATVLVAPLFGGGGTRYKILEAMASGLPVVTTTIGIEGLEAKNNRHVLISDNPSEIANLTVKLIREKPLSRNIARQAKKFVYKNFDWQVISKELERIYEDVAHHAKKD